MAVEAVCKVAKGFRQNNSGTCIVYVAALQLSRAMPSPRNDMGFTGEFQ